MNTITLTLPDESKIRVESGMCGYDVVGEISKGLQARAVAIKVDGTLRDLSTKIDNDARFEVITFDSEEGRQVFWHSASHLMAQAVKRLYPDAKYTIGPAIETGFYYDFD
ncbi:MAG: TGS domain-containing protein, partial [Spirochaetes bacterium]|nr:TGS domain-containing protein [Spirochaetota bacterium]